MEREKGVFWGILFFRENWTTRRAECVGGARRCGLDHAVGQGRGGGRGAGGEGD